MSSHKAPEDNEKEKQVFLFELEKAAASMDIFAGELFDLARFLEVFQPELESLETQVEKCDEIMNDMDLVIRSYNDFVQIACETVGYHFNKWDERVYDEELEEHFWSLRNRTAKLRAELKCQSWELRMLKDACINQKEYRLH